MSTSQDYPDLSPERDDDLYEQEREARRLALRENAKHILRESGLAEMLQSINKNLLKGRGRFEEYDSLVLFRWGTQSTRRHMWIEVRGSSILFRLHPHRTCAQAAPVCDGEYHTFTSTMWSDRELLKAELKKYYDRPVAESSAD
ncbi:hypothetical protein [Dictyobacter kobayashii]|uniref:DUF5655 domain-containing protein n=1 Tax=Dictyobacter kobayashii TaxID=2014872 RepID=A0A402AMU4_9CHLR|nr:hypothetical protein [Dictyobacter kobayashii]GCE20457.1 hypothetical protein KDK_42570 [Dictyobacter kobayashii]